MRIFWAVIMLLVAATIGVVLLTGRSSGPAPVEAVEADSPTDPGRSADSAGDLAPDVAAEASPSEPTESGAAQELPVGDPAGVTVAQEINPPEAAETNPPNIEGRNGGNPVSPPVVGVPTQSGAAPTGESDRTTTPEASVASDPTGSERRPPAEESVEVAAPAAAPEAEATQPDVVAPAGQPEADVTTPATPTQEAIVPVVPAVVPDPISTRSAMGLLANVMTQSQAAPGADFIGRLAVAAMGYWSPAPEVQAQVAGSARAYRIASNQGGADVFVADDGAGNNVTIILPRPEVDTLYAMLEQSAQLALAAGDEGDAQVENYGVSLNGKAAGTLAIRPVREGVGAGGLMLTFIGTTPVPAESRLPAGAASDISYEVQPDGSIKLSNGTVIQGNGTPEKPYAITWELLASAERVYQPRNGLTGLPKWCTALHEKHVRITGHLLSPLMMDDTTQILLMRNQWDGCCVGVPPSPYDAIEVELGRPVSLVREQLNYGTLTGVFEVDPYLVNNWLVGLWLLSESKIDSANAQNWAVPMSPN